jgi:hypothetical protein
MTCETCRDLLNEALNLACRSDQFEEQRRRQANLDASACAEEWLESGRFDAYVERHNLLNPHRKIAVKSMTMHLWVQDQYDKDLADWQIRARAHLMKGCAP